MKKSNGFVKSGLATLVGAAATVFGGSAFASFEAGLEACRRGDVDVAIDIWERFGLAGDVRSKKVLGDIYSHYQGPDMVDASCPPAGGNDRRKDDVQAMKWYTLAAFHEFGEYVTPKPAEVNAKILAETRLSEVKFNLKSSEVDKAEGLIEDAYESGSPHEIYQLARLYQYGNGVAKDNVKAAQFYQIAAMNGVKAAGPAYEKVKDLLSEKESLDTKKKVVAWQPPLPKLHKGDTAQMKQLKALIDELEAERLQSARVKLFDVRDDMQLIQRALKVTGFDPGAIDGKEGPATRRAFNDFQRVYKFPISPKLQDDALVKLFEKAAGNGDAYSQYAFGVMHLEGIGVTPHGKNAEKWLKAAREQDLTESYYALGVLYRDGLDTPPDGQKKTAIKANTENARSAFAQAAYRGYGPAQRALEELNQ